MDVKDVIIRAKNGNKEAFAALFNEYYDPLFRFVMSRVYNKDKSVDICQDVFLRWYEALPRYELSGASPLSYLFTIAMRLVINESSKKKTDYLKDDADEYMSDDSPGTEYWNDVQISLEQVKSLLPQLSDSERIVLELKYISDLDNKEISSIIDKNVDAIRQLEHRALKKLKNLYTQQYAK